MVEIREPDCPRCGQPPGMLMCPEQVFCTNDNCDTLTWDMTKTRAENEAAATTIDLSGLETR